MKVSTEIKTAVAKKILASRRYYGMSFDLIRHGFDRAKTVEIVYAIRELLDEGAIEMTETRFADGFDWRTETTYRRKFA